MEQRGTVKKDERTKNLVARLVPGDIALIDHVDIDRVSAESLVATGVSVVINASRSISGRYPNEGPSILLAAGITLVDDVGRATFDELSEDDVVTVRDGVIVRDGDTVGSGVVLTPEMAEREKHAAEGELDRRLEDFVRNTLSYVTSEHSVLLSDMQVPQTTVQLAGRHVLVVARGPSFTRDIRAMRGYIDDVHPAVIAVDGAADSLLSQRIKPDVIVGDMDSVSDAGLRCGAQLIAHAYPDGRCPAARRLDGLGVPYTTWALPATSEDLGLLLAYHSRAGLIVSLGTHSSLNDYLDKGRSGAASSFLVQLKVRDRLVDARGVSELYHSVPKRSYVVPLLLVGVIAIVAVIVVSEPLRSTLRLLVLTIQAWFGALF
ncbi:MAG: putative cytokinetic ring protein SteA [Coriobacteriales bacterium]|jgi:uncharacterized membrane-anchored protein